MESSSSSFTSPEDDWLCHNGNVHYARNRRDFETYQAVDPSRGPVLARLLDTTIDHPVLGVGTVRLRVKKRLGSSEIAVVTLLSVYHIPSGMCNGIALSDLRAVGWVQEERSNQRFCFTVAATGEDVMCGDGSGGRMRIYAAKDDDSLKARSLHFTYDRVISFMADPSIRLTSKIQHPVDENPGRSGYIRPGPHACKCAPCSTRDQHMEVKREQTNGQNTSTSKSQDHDDDITPKELWDAYRQDPDRLAHKEREKRQREEDQENERKLQKSRKLDPYACCKQQRSLPYDFHFRTSNDWLFQNGNATYVRTKDHFLTFKPLVAYAHINQTFTDGRPPLNRHIAVAGIGTVNLTVKRQLGQNATYVLTFYKKLYIPDAGCNGISLPAVEEGGFQIKPPKRNQGQRWSIVRPDGKGTVGCGTSASGRTRLLLPGENDMVDEPRHVTIGQPVVISADLGYISSLAG